MVSEQVSWWNYVSHIKPEHSKPKFHCLSLPPVISRCFNVGVVPCSLYITDSILRQGVRGKDRGTGEAKQIPAAPYIIYCIRKKRTISWKVALWDYGNHNAGERADPGAQNADGREHSQKWPCNMAVPADNGSRCYLKAAVMARNPDYEEPGEAAGWL